MKPSITKMQVQLIAVSPVIFILARVGDVVTLKRMRPKLNEYREKIPAATTAGESILVFKGETKIGVIPHDDWVKIKDLTVSKNCRITDMNKEKSTVLITVSVK